MAAAAGVGIGIVVGGVWALSVRSAALLILVPLPAIVTPACAGGLGPELRVLLSGTTTLTVAEAAARDVDSKDTIEITDGVARIDQMVVYSRKLENTRPGMSHDTRFFAPVGPAVGDTPPWKVWFACHRSVEVANSEAECTKLLQAKPMLGRWKATWDQELRTVAKEPLPPGPGPRVYEVQDSPGDEALSNLLFVALLMLLNLGSCFYVVFLARRS